MKTKECAFALLFLFCSFFLSVSSYGQLTLDDFSSQWNIGTHCVNEGAMNPYDKWSTSFFHIEGDTVMNEKHYKKLVSCADSFCVNKSLKSYIREDAGQVFLANKTEEILQFDFNLQQGDTMIMDFLQDVSRDVRLYIRVDSVKSMVLQGQNERIAQYVTVFDYYNSQLADHSINDVFVEGIGSLTFGLEYPRNLFMTGEQFCHPSLLCFSSGDDIIYSNPEFNNCYLSTGLPLTVDAGNDIVLCFSDLATSTAQLGGFPVASGGVEPYTYTWSGKILQFFGPEDSTWVYASYFLDDTTKINPTFRRGEIAFDWPVFNLKVEDAAGNVEHDSVKIIDASIWSLLIYMPPVTIKRGDSVQFYGDINYKDCDENYNFLPFNYTLSPTHGLTDPTDLYGWAKPDTSTTYYLQVVNSAGCVSKKGYWRINVDTTSVSANDVASRSAQCYLSQGDLIIHLPEKSHSTYQLTITTANGVIVHAGEYTNRDLRLSNLRLKENQLYVVSIVDGKEKKVFKLIGN